MEVQHGGGIAWRCCMDVLHGVLHGGVAWRCCMEVLHGGVACVTWMCYREQDVKDANHVLSFIAPISMVIKKIKVQLLASIHRHVPCVAATVP